MFWRRAVSPSSQGKKVSVLTDVSDGNPDLARRISGDYRKQAHRKRVQFQRLLSRDSVATGWIQIF
jgi:hypothetical protein